MTKQNMTKQNKAKQKKIEQNKAKQKKIEQKAQALIELSELCDKNQVYILPRMGLLLGVIRHQSFLPNEPLDLDITAHANDVEKIKACDWGGFIIEFDDLYGFCEPGRVGNSFFNGHHPISGEKMSPLRIVVKGRGIGAHGPLMYDYKPGYIAQPAAYAELNYKQEIFINKIYHEKWGFETGPRNLGVEGEPPLTSAHLELKEGDKGWGTVATKYKSSDVFPVRKARFADGYVNVPGNAEEILKQHYGKDCLDVMITKHGFMHTFNEDTDPRVKINNTLNTEKNNG